MIGRLASTPLLVLLLAGCAGLEVKALGNAEVIALDGEDVVHLMRRAGFSDEEVLEHGTDLRNALALEGSAEVRSEGKVEALFAVSGHHVHVTTRDHGSVIYDAETKTFR